MIKPIVSTKLVIITLLMLIALGVCHAGILRPRQRLLKLIITEIKQKSEQLDRLQQMKSAPAQQQYKEALQKEEQAYAGLVFSEETLNRLDFQIRDLATKNKIQTFTSRNLMSQTDRNTSKSKLIDQQQISIQAECGFLGFLRFINGLERNTNALFINQWDLTGGPITQDMDKMTSKIELCALKEKLPN